RRGPALARRAGGNPGGLPQQSRTAARSRRSLHVVGSPAAYQRPGLARRAPSPAPGAAATRARDDPPPGLRRTRRRGVHRLGGPAGGGGAAQRRDRAFVTMLMAGLVPAGPARDRLAATIVALATEHGTPRFEPHVTMAGLFHSGEEAAGQALTSLAAGVRPFEVGFAAVGYEQAYFRALFLRADPSPQLTALHEAARAAWGLDVRP